MHVVALIVGLLAFSPSAAWTQTENSSPDLPRGFYELNLGDELGRVKESLRGHPYFDYRGEGDVSFLPKRPEVLIDCEGRFYLKRGLFQFHEDRLYILTLIFNPLRMDYYSLFTTLSKKYGPPVYLDPAGAVWENETVRLSLEKPLTIKYIERGVFTKLQNAGKAEKSVEELSRERFLELF